MKHRYSFSLSDGSVVELDCDSIFLNVLRKKFELSDDEEVTVQHVKRMFLDSIRGAAEEV